VPAGIFTDGYPSDEFTFIRSYISRFCIISTSTDIDQFGDTFTVWFDRSIGYGATFTLRSDFLPWNSNRYRLDNVVEDLYWHAFFDSIHHPDSYSAAVTWRGDPVLQTYSITLSSGGTEEVFLPLDHSPGDYWLPNLE
jgi:hypothetical protein